jgi:hypothetical protein
MTLPSSSQVQDFVGEIAAARTEMQLVPFVGAGLSAPFGFPLWREFLNQLAESAPPDARLPLRVASKLGPVAFAGRIEQCLGSARIRDAIGRRFVKSAREDASAAAHVLPQLGCSLVLTTNYDCILEDVAFAGRDIVVQYGSDALSSVQEIEARSTAPEKQVRGTAIVKLHGCASRALSCVLTPDDYFAAHEDEFFDDPFPTIRQACRSAIAHNSLLFLGCSLLDDPFLAIYAELKKRGTLLPPQFAIVRRPDDEEKTDRLRRQCADAGIRLHLLEATRKSESADTNKELAEILREIARQTASSKVPSELSPRGRRAALVFSPRNLLRVPDEGAEKTIESALRDAGLTATAVRDEALTPTRCWTVELSDEPRADSEPVREVVLDRVLRAVEAARLHHDNAVGIGLPTSSTSSSERSARLMASVVALTQCLSGADKSLLGLVATQSRIDPPFDRSQAGTLHDGATAKDVTGRGQESLRSGVLPHFSMATDVVLPKIISRPPGELDRWWVVPAFQSGGAASDVRWNSRERYVRDGEEISLVDDLIRHGIVDESARAHVRFACRTARPGAHDAQLAIHCWPGARALGTPVMDRTQITMGLGSSWANRSWIWPAPLTRGISIRATTAGATRLTFWRTRMETERVMAPFLGPLARAKTMCILRIELVAAPNNNGAVASREGHQKKVTMKS